MSNLTQTLICDGYLVVQTHTFKMPELAQCYEQSFCILSSGGSFFGQLPLVIEVDYSVTLTLIILLCTSSSSCTNIIVTLFTLT